MNPRYKPFYLFALLLALFPAIGVFVEALESGFAALLWWQWLLLLALLVLAWAWFRHFSVLGCQDACNLDDPGKVQNPGRHP